MDISGIFWNYQNYHKTFSYIPRTPKRAIGTTVFQSERCWSVPEQNGDGALLSNTAYYFSIIIIINACNTGTLKRRVCHEIGDQSLI